MKSLFLKIFLWFWAAMALVVVVVVLLVSSTQESDHQRDMERMREFHENWRRNHPEEPAGHGRRRGFSGPPGARRRNMLPLIWLRSDPKNQAVRLLALLATTGLVCYGLVRHLTKPVGQLSDAARRLAAGDFGSRVGPKLRRRKDELGTLGRDFDFMAERIEGLMKAQHQLIADVSHELRSPLARVNVALGLVRGTAGPEAAEDLDRIEREAERLNTMIGQLLALSRMENSEGPPENEPVELEPLLREIAADAAFEAGDGCTVTVEISRPCTVRGSDALLSSAIENVVRNAVRYTAPGSEVKIALKVDDADESHHAVVTISDHGPGVPDEDLEHIFRPFHRIATARDRQSGGTGLGLAITERALRLHGGTAKATNRPGGGLQVELRLPVV